MRDRLERRIGEGARRRALAAAGLVAAALGAPSACNTEETRPGLIADCSGPGCVGFRDGVPVSVGAGADAGASGAGGGGGMPTPGVGTLAGSVVELGAPDLQTTQGLGGIVEVRAASASGVVSGETGADGAFRLDGVLASPVTWVGVGQFRSPPLEPYIDTLQAVDASTGDLVRLLVARRDALREAVSVAFLIAQDPVELDPERAQLVVRFVRENGQPLAGVRIVVPPPEQVPTAYDADDTFSSVLEETSARGMALLVNLPAAPYPGVITSVVADLDGDQLSAEVRIASGALTVVSAIVPDP